LTLEEYRSLKIGDEVILVGDVTKIDIHCQYLVEEQAVGVVSEVYNSFCYGTEKPWMVYFDTQEGFRKKYIVSPPFLERALHEKICPTCDGVGFLEGFPTCPDCQGQGIICL